MLEMHEEACALEPFLREATPGTEAGAEEVPARPEGDLEQPEPAARP